MNLLPLCETVFGTEPDLVLALMYDQKRFGLLQTDDAIESRYSLCLRSMRALLSRRSLRYFSQAGFWEVRASPPRSRDKAFFRAESLLCRRWITSLSIHGGLLSLIFIFGTCCSTHAMNRSCQHCQSSSTFSLSRAQRKGVASKVTLRASKSAFL